MFAEIISGGQPGVDLAVLEAANAFGITTGGYTPRDFDNKLAQQFGLRPSTAAAHNSHIRVNVRVADATLSFARGLNRPRARLRRELTEEYGKPHLEVAWDTGQRLPTPEDVAAWLVERRVSVLYVTGDTEMVSPGIGDGAASYIREVFQLLLNRRQLKQQGASTPEESPVWASRKTGQRRRQGKPNVVEGFLQDPSDETSRRLRQAAQAWTWDTILRAAQVPHLTQLPIAEIRQLTQIVEDVDELIAARLQAFVDGEAGNLRELTEGFVRWEARVWDQRAEFQTYVAGVALLTYLQSATQDDVRQRIARLLVWCFDHHIESFLRYLQRRRYDEEWTVVREGVMEQLIDENMNYLVNDTPGSFRKLTKWLAWRASRRLNSAWNKETSRGSRYTMELPAEDRFDTSERPAHQGPRLPLEYRTDIESKVSQLLDVLRPIACEAAAKFPNAEGRRLFLWLVLGGLSHRRTNQLRSGHPSTKYLVQSSLIGMLLNQDENAIDRWFARPVHRLMKELDCYERAIKTFCRRTVPQRIESSRARGEVTWLGEEVDVLVEREQQSFPEPPPETRETRLYGWKVFAELSNRAARMIQEGLLTPNLRSIDADAWVDDFRGKFERPADLELAILADATKFACHLAGQSEDAQLGWQECFDDFAEE